ncbi:FecR family protein [Sulfuritalea sp.]|uniref:FecR family protein n=1 Tax=Sulfuritalea sp. TaxID=2480090 RepID=UPI001ACF1B7A|nr:FecR family protein [Sulfuritalea sp.]MBN8474595.1 FecR domain-containing protein [Sulfuritalea sp.]
MRPLNRLFTGVFALVAFLSGAVWAAAPATVEVVQAPAWLDRGGMTQPLAAGMEIKSGDVVRTGSGARAYLMLAEGSRVKLGESARFSVHTRSLQPEKTFRGALDVLAGAFRYTTGKLKKAQPREVAIRVGTATIGIRGTDVWGKTDKDGDLVALLEGRIEITRAGQVTEMAEPLTYFDAPSGQSAAVKPLDPEVFKKLARQTEILAGDGAASARGKRSILAGSADSEAGALAIYDQARDAGFAARIRPREMEGGGWAYDVVLGGYASAAEAGVAAARLKAATELMPRVVN